MNTATGTQFNAFHGGTMQEEDIPPHDFPPEATKERPSTREPALATPLDWPALAGQEPPHRRWALEGWVGYGHTTLLVGAGGIGKTLIAQQIGSALALQKPFIEPTKRARVLMWACEDDHDELWRRQCAISRYFRVGIEEFEDFILIPRHGQDNALCVSNFGAPAVTPLIQTLTEQANDFNAEVVILDNVAQLYGAGENDRHAVTWFLNNLSGALGNRAILLLAHPSRSQGSEFSGSGAWENVARTRLYLGSKLPDEKPDPDQEVNQDERYLCRRKANYSNKDWRRFTYQNGVLVPDEIDLKGGIVGHIREQAVEKCIIDSIQKLASMGIYAQEGSRSPQYLPRLITEYKLGNGYSKPDLAGAMRKLMLDGKVTRAVVGKNANRTERIGLVLAQ